jgi:hypothetical protein
MDYKRFKMTEDKLISETDILKKFFTIYCHGKKHNNIKHQKVNLTLHNKDYLQEVELCDECFALLSYSFDRLINCQHDEKPKCRTCPTPCYEPTQWKQVAKVMRYAGINTGINKIKGFFTR